MTSKITLLGTSHIARESSEKAKRYLRGKDCAAVELDPLRYQSMLRGDRGRPDGIFFRLLQYVQKRLGEAAGMSPGHEMLDTIESANEKGIPVYMIDVDIRVTTARLRDAPFLEKASLFLPVLGPGMEFDLDEVPPEEMIEETMLELKERAPVIYDALVTKRNHYMVSWVKKLAEEHEDVLVVVGAAHVKGMERLLKSEGLKVRVV